MQELKPFLRGSIRWVREEVWEQYSETIDYYRNPDRQHHPGCVVIPPTSQNPTVVFIHGHSKPSHPSRYELPVKGLTSEEKVGYFTINRRYPVPPHVAWTQTNVSKENLRKSMLDDEEIEMLSVLETRYKTELIENSSSQSRLIFKNAHPNAVGK